MRSIRSVSIALCSDERYAPGLFVAATSILMHMDPKRPVELFVLDTGLSDRSWHRFKAHVRKFSSSVQTVRLRPDLSAFMGCPSLRGSHAAYSLLLLPELVNRQKLLCFDVDMLVLKDVGALWDLDMERNTALAVFEPGVTLRDDCVWLATDDPDGELPYFNSGTIALDLHQWRSRAVGQRVSDLIQAYANDLKTHDQTILNYVLRHEAGRLDPSWNLFDVGDVAPGEFQEPTGVVVHITHNKPWLTFKNLRGSLLWISFHDQFVSRVPAVLRYGVIWRIRKWSNFRSALRTLAEALLLRARPTRGAVLRFLSKSPAQRFKIHWLLRWFKRMANSPSADRDNDRKA